MEPRSNLPSIYPEKLVTEGLTWFLRFQEGTTWNKPIAVPHFGKAQRSTPHAAAAPPGYMYLSFLPRPKPIEAQVLGNPGHSTFRLHHLHTSPNAILFAPTLHFHLFLGPRDRFVYQRKLPQTRDSAIAHLLPLAIPPKAPFNEEAYFHPSHLTTRRQVRPHTGPVSPLEAFRHRKSLARTARLPISQTSPLAPAHTSLLLETDWLRGSPRPCALVNVAHTCGSRREPYIRGRTLVPNPLGLGCDISGPAVS